MGAADTEGFDDGPDDEGPEEMEGANGFDVPEPVDDRDAGEKPQFLEAREETQEPREPQEPQEPQEPGSGSGSGSDDDLQ